MPRIYDGDSNPIDLCRRHFPSEQVAHARYGSGEGPDGRGNCYSYNDEHPPYEGENYFCETCHRRLTAKDE